MIYFTIHPHIALEVFGCTSSWAHSTSADYTESYETNSIFTIGKGPETHFVIYFMHVNGSFRLDTFLNYALNRIKIPVSGSSEYFYDLLHWLLSWSEFYITFVELMVPNKPVKVSLHSNSIRAVLSTLRKVFAVIADSIILLALSYNNQPLLICKVIWI